MTRRFLGVILLTGLLLLLAVVGSEARVIVDTGEGGGSAGMTSSTQFSPLAASADATGCVDNTTSWLGPGQTIGTSNGDEPAYVIYVHIPSGNSTKIPTFCTDLVTSIGKGACFQAAGPTACPITWLLNNGYGPEAGLLNAEAAARQAAIWKFSDNLTVTSPAAVVARTQQIIAAVPDPCVLPQSAPVMTLDPPSDVNFLPGGEVHEVTVSVTQDGKPLAGQLVNLSLSAPVVGELSTSSVTTGADGTASFTLTSDTTGTATVTASFSYLLPAGTRMTKLDGAADQQVLVLGTPQTGNVIATATKTWEDGTTIIVHKFSDNNTNGVQDGGEESLANWTMKLYKWNDPNWQLVATKTTNAAGNAIFDNLSAGIYQAQETLQSGWYNTTQNNPSAPVTLAAGEQATINFGNVALAVIKAWKFNDLDGDGVHDTGEPVLDGWQMNIDPANNGIGSGLTSGGSYSFIDLTPGTYRVWETQQAGWTATTPAEVQVIVEANDFREIWFGNAQLDFGDLPDGPYPTLLDNNGPRHIIQSGVFLGAAVDAETNGQPDGEATGDDAAGAPDDEDGVVFGPLEAGKAAEIQVTASVAGCLNAWVDYNNNGGLTDSGEQIAANLEVEAGATTLNVTVPTTAQGLVYSRFRFTQQCGQGGQSPTGLATSGEVEDYAVTIRTPTAVSLVGFSASGRQMPWGGIALLGAVLAGLVVSLRRSQQ